MTGLDNIKNCKTIYPSLTYLPILTRRKISLCHKTFRFDKTFIKLLRIFCEGIDKNGKMIMTLKVWKINVVQFSLSQFKWQIRGELLENIFVKLFVS